MGLTKNSTGRFAADSGLILNKNFEQKKIVALAGNPNVGKSTIFNALTGMNQHTGNWPGKTVSSAEGFCKTDKNDCILVDIPGTYSLLAHSAEETVARDFICFGNTDAIIVVCDATCLERNMNLVLQILEITDNVLLCINLLDEANRKKIKIDIPLLSKKLGIPVVGTIGRNKKSLIKLKKALDLALNTNNNSYKVIYRKEIEDAVSLIIPVLHKYKSIPVSAHWLAQRLLCENNFLHKEIKDYCDVDLSADEELSRVLATATELLNENGIDKEKLEDEIVKTIISTGEDICKQVVKTENINYNATDRKIDTLLTGKRFGIPAMLLLLCIIFFITITGANYPSALLSAFFERIGTYFSDFLSLLHLPNWAHSMLTDGMYKVLTWVIAVMLPPMAIFFPLFTFLEDIGYLPRIAYNLDCPFKKCKACGKQALTMCMGFGCNAAGVVGCRIIDSPRERMLAILTNSFVPCNGRFPALISVITMFFIGFSAGFTSSVMSSLLLTAIIIFSVIMTMTATAFLSKTFLKGLPSSFTLELPPYRRPQVFKIVVRSVFDRTLFVLGRAIAVAAPAGIIIWFFANFYINGSSLLSICAGFLDPFARLMGMDGIILIAFILGFPANEIVIPIMIMAYTAQGTLSNATDLTQLKALLEANGWTWVTAICVMIFILMHWPCSTTLMTIKKETGSFKWTAVAALLPTFFGMIICIFINLISKIFI